MPKDDNNTYQDSQDTRAISRGKISGNVALQVFLALGIFVLINVLSTFWQKQWDLSKIKRYTLSPATKKIIKNFPGKADIKVVFSRQNPLFEEVRVLMESIKDYKSSKTKIKFLDPHKDIDKVKKLTRENNIQTNDDFIAVMKDGKVELINSFDLISDPLSFREVGVISGFRGEEVISSALLKVSEEKPKKLYFLAGHGNKNAKSSLSVIKSYLENQNAKIEAINFNAKTTIPEDADALLLIGITYDLSPEETQILENYWLENPKSSLLICLNPNSKTPNLSNFLARYAVAPNNDVVLKTHGTLGKKIQTSFIVPATFILAPGVPKELYSVNTVLPPWTTSLNVKQSEIKERDENLVVTPALISADEDFWGERDFSEKVPAFNPRVDTRSPFVFAVAVEKKRKKGGKKMEPAQMALIGNASLADSDARPLINKNIDFVIGSINWLLRREKLVSINPKKYNLYGLKLEDSQFNSILILSFIFAFILIIIGILIRSFRKV